MNKQVQPKNKVDVVGIRGQNGAAALIAVCILSLVVVTTISTVYVYLVNRSKYHAKIREAYAMTQVTEELAKMTRQAYDLGLAAGAGNCPDGVAPTTIGTSRFCLPANPCVQSVSNIQAQYCINAASIQTVADGSLQGQKSQFIAEFDVGPKKQGQESVSSKLVKDFYARLDRFFDSSAQVTRKSSQHFESVLAANLTPPTLMGWLLPQAHAQTDTGTIEIIGVGQDYPIVRDHYIPPNDPTRAYYRPGQGGGGTNSPRQIISTCTANPSSSQCQDIVRRCDVPTTTDPQCAQICNFGGSGGSQGQGGGSLPSFCTAPGQAAIRIAQPPSPAYSCGQPAAAAQGIQSPAQVVGAGSPCVALRIINPLDANTPIRIAFAMVQQ